MFWQNRAIHAVPSACSSAPAGQRRASVEHADIVQPEKTTLEDVFAETVLAVHPPREIQQSACANTTLQEFEIAATLAPSLTPIEEKRRPSMHRRIDVAEIPFVGRHLAVRVEIASAQHQLELILGEVRIDRATVRAYGMPDPRRRTTDTPTCLASR